MMETSAELVDGVTVMPQVLLVAVTGVGVSESVALVLKEDTPPAPVGVPVTAPVVAFRFKPAGSDPGVIVNV